MYIVLWFFTSSLDISWILNVTFCCLDLLPFADIVCASHMCASCYLLPDASVILQDELINFFAHFEYKSLCVHVNGLYMD